MSNVNIKQRKKVNENIDNGPIVVTYPRDVYFAGSKVGTQKVNGEIIFDDYKTGMAMINLIQTKAYGVTDKDSRGNQTKHVTIIPLSTKEDNNIARKKLELNKRQGQIF